MDLKYEVFISKFFIKILIRHPWLSLSKIYYLLVILELFSIYIEKGKCKKDHCLHKITTNFFLSFLIRRFNIIKNKDSIFTAY